MTTMTPHSRRRARLGARALVVAAVLAVAGCAGMPTSGSVRESAVDVDEPGEIVYYAAGPAVDGEPQTIVEGFLRAAEAGPTSNVPFGVAREFLTPSAWNGWERYGRVLVLDGDPTVLVGDHDDASTTVQVRARASVVASVDERGTYSEEPRPSPVELTFELTRGIDGQWRISELEDGLLVSQGVFTTAFHRTPLYFPTPDRAYLVPDVRWFPRPTWRTSAVRELLAGPVEWLGDSVISVFPGGTQLAIQSVTVDDDGTIGVNLTAPISEASAEDRALITAQLRATLVQGDGRSVVLYDQTAPLRVTETSEPSLPTTRGDAVAYVDGTLRRVEGRGLADLEVPVELHGVEPTALALGPDGDPVVARVGARSIVRLSGPEAPVKLLSGEDLAEPSVDRFGTVWSAERDLVRVVLVSNRSYSIAADWLAGRTVESLRVSPDGARVAIVSSGPGGRQVHVSGIQRDAQLVPTGLSVPVRVGASVGAVRLAVWQEDAVLALLGTDPDGGPGLFVAGVGGLAGQGGLARPVTAVVDPVWVTAGVGSPEMLVLDDDGTLFSRQSSALWPVVSEGVELVAYPG